MIMPVKRNTTPAPAQKAPPKSFTVSSGVKRHADRICIYGAGGVGKTRLAAIAPKPVFIDLEHGADDLDVARVNGIENWADLRAFVQTASLDGSSTLVLDSATKAEAMCVQHVLQTVKLPDGSLATSIEDYGYGKGYVFVYEEFRRLLADLEKLYQQGITILLICHDVDAVIKNAVGEDFKRRQPRLYNTDRAPIVNTVREWCDHVFCLEQDISAIKQKGSLGPAKATGGLSRTIYTSDTPARMAKSRRLPPEQIAYVFGDTVLWDMLNGTANTQQPAADEPPAE